MTREQADLLRCAARWMWHGGRPAKAAIRLLNVKARRGPYDERVLRETLADIDAEG